ncbi:translocation/assembly module TamB [Haloglomus salinum]|uniref:translocation/assembly module TamB n=1 Tax=Haloglomus salinum TaxID=2962673 RepID=UPI0020C9911E|nr:translocation/assembly module TamB [Haloglomus salinum]
MPQNDRAGGSVSRRRLLAAAAGAAATTGLAGCSQGNDADSPTSTPTATGTGTDTSTATDTPSPTATLPSCDDPEPLTPADVESGGTVSEGCYRAEKTLTVESGTLTLEAGVVIQFTSNTGLVVESDGVVRAQGSGSKPVVLTATDETRGFWKGLYLDNSTSSDNALEHTVVEYAGGESWNVNWESGAITTRKARLALDGCVLRENAAAGLRVRKLADQLSLSNTRFEANALPAWVHSSVAGAFSPDNAFVDNDTSAIRLGSDGADPVRSEQTWQHPGVPYHVIKHVELEAPVTVTEGATFRFSQGKGLSVIREGRLTVTGSEDAPVRFTGREAVRGAWKGLRYETSKSTDNVLDRAIVEYAGDSAWNPNHEPAGIFARGNAIALTVRNTTIRENATMGLAATGPKANLTVERTAFEANDAPLLVQANLVDGIAPSNAIGGNDEPFVFVSDLGFGGAGSTVVDPATWAALDVPYRPKVNVFIEAPVEIAPGTAFQFEQDRGIRVRGDGRLRAAGAQTDPITFAGVEGISGFWKGLSFVNSLSTDNVLQNVVIENGGSSEWVGGAAPDRANLMVEGGGDAAAVTVSDSTIAGSGKYGIAIGDDEARVMSCDNVAFENNSDADTYNLDTKAPISNCQ